MDDPADLYQFIRDFIDIFCKREVVHHPVQRIAKEHKNSKKHSRSCSFHPPFWEKTHRLNSVIRHPRYYRKQPDKAVIFLVKAQLCYDIFHNNRVIHRQEQNSRAANKNHGAFFPSPDQRGNQSNGKKGRIPAGTPVQFHTGIHKFHSQLFNCYSTHSSAPFYDAARLSSPSLHAKYTPA